VHEGWQTLAAIVGGIFTVAIVAVIVSRNAQTSGVISSAGSALSSVIQAAVAPVTSSGNSFLPGQ
jgi:hypothetical protein